MSNNNIESSNLSHAEYFRLNGNLSQERTENVLDDLHQAQSMDVREYAPYAQEARGSFIEEDFLGSQIKDLQVLAKNLRGANRQELFDIIACIRDVVNEQVLNAEYANEQLGYIVNTVKR